MPKLLVHFMLAIYFWAWELAGMWIIRLVLFHWRKLIFPHGYKASFFWVDWSSTVTWTIQTRDRYGGSSWPIREIKQPRPKNSSLLSIHRQKGRLCPQIASANSTNPLMPFIDWMLASMWLETNFLRLTLFLPYIPFSSQQYHSCLYLPKHLD